MTSMKVAVRARPLNDREIHFGSNVVVDVFENDIVISDSKATEQHDYDHRSRFHKFTFDYGFSSVDPTSGRYASQATVYEDFGRVVLQALLEGYNSCVIAYGQSGSGKTYTMMGTKEEEGLTPRICQGLLSKLTDKAKENISFHMDISYMEIYNEHVYDLLKKNEVKNRYNKKPHLRIREHPVHGPYVEGLSVHMVNDIDNIFQLLATGNDNRTKAATHVHDRSSRSHAIFTVRCYQACLDETQPKETISKLHMVDLAGSEKAGPEFCQSRIKEGANINKSLVTLGNVISALVELSQRLKNAPNCGGRLPFVPYRDSHLTWLLKDSLGGNSHTFMLAAISPSKESYTETVSTLRYAQRAKNVLNSPVVNEDPGTKIIHELRMEVTKLKDLLANAELISKRAIIISLPDISQLNAFMKESEVKVDQLTKNWFEKWLQTYKIVLKKVKNNKTEASSDDNENKNIPEKCILKIEGKANTEQETTDRKVRAQNISMKEKKERAFDSSVLNKKELIMSNETIDIKASDFNATQNFIYSTASSECVILPNEIIYYTKKKSVPDSQCSNKSGNAEKSIFSHLNGTNFCNSHVTTNSAIAHNAFDPNTSGEGTNFCQSEDNVWEHFSNFPPNRTPLSISVSNIQYPFVSSYWTNQNKSVPMNMHISSCEVPKKSREMLPEPNLTCLKEVNDDDDNNKQTITHTVELEKSLTVQFEKSESFVDLSTHKQKRATENNVGHHIKSTKEGENGLNNFSCVFGEEFNHFKEPKAIINTDSDNLSLNADTKFNYVTKSKKYVDNFHEGLIGQFKNNSNESIYQVGETVREFGSTEIQFDDHVAEESHNFVKLLHGLHQDSKDMINDDNHSRRGSDIWSLLSLSSNDYPFHESVEDFSSNDNVTGSNIAMNNENFYIESFPEKFNVTAEHQSSNMTKDCEYFEENPECDYGNFSSDSSQSTPVYEVPPLSSNKLKPFVYLNEVGNDSHVENDNAVLSKLYGRHDESSIDLTENDSLAHSCFSIDEMNSQQSIPIKISESLNQSEENMYDGKIVIGSTANSKFKSSSIESISLHLNCDSHARAFKENPKLSLSCVNINSEAVEPVQFKLIDHYGNPEKIFDCENRCTFKSDQSMNISHRDKKVSVIHKSHSDETSTQLKDNETDVKIKKDNTNAFQLEHNKSCKFSSQDIPTLIGDAQFEELCNSLKYGGSSPDAKNNYIYKGLKPDELQDFIDATEVTDAEKFMEALLNNELMHSPHKSTNYNHGHCLTEKYGKFQAEHPAVNANSASILDDQTFQIVDAFEGLDTTVRSNLPQTHGSETELHNQSYVWTKNAVMNSSENNHIQNIARKNYCEQIVPRDENYNKHFEKMATLNERNLQFNVCNSFTSKDIWTCRKGNVTDCTLSNINTKEVHNETEDQVQYFKNNTDMGENEISKLPKNIPISEEENSIMLSPSPNSLYCESPVSVEYPDACDKIYINYSDFAIAQNEDLSPIEEEEKSKGGSSNSSKSSLVKTGNLKEAKDLLWTTTLNQNTKSKNEINFENSDYCCETYEKYNFACNATVDDGVKMHHLDDNSINYSPDLSFKHLDNVRNFQNHPGSYSSLSSSSDSITYVFVGKDHKESIDFDAPGSLYSSKLGSVSLDSLEKSSSQQQQVACISPRTLSIDSLIAEELLFQLRNGENLAVPINNRHHLKNSNQKNNNVCHFHHERLHSGINEFSNTGPFNDNLSVVPYHQLKPVSSDNGNYDLQYPNEDSLLKGSLPQHPQPCTISMNKYSKNEGYETLINSKSHHSSETSDKHITSRTNSCKLHTSENLPLNATKKSDSDVMVNGDTASQEMIQPIDSFIKPVMHLTKDHEEILDNFKLEKDDYLAPFKMNDYLTNGAPNDILSNHYAWDESQCFMENVGIKTNANDNYLDVENTTSVKELTKENLKLFELEFEENQVPAFLLPPPPLFGSSKGENDGKGEPALSNINSNPTASVQTEIKTVTSKGMQTGESYQESNSNNTSTSELILRMMELLTDIIKILKEEPACSTKQKVKKSVKRKICFSPKNVKNISHKNVLHSNSNDSEINKNVLNEPQPKNFHFPFTPCENKTYLCHSCYQPLKRMVIPFEPPKECENIDFDVAINKHKMFNNQITHHLPQNHLPCFQKSPTSLHYENQQTRQQLKVSKSRKTSFFNQVGDIYQPTCSENSNLINSELLIQNDSPNIPSVSKPRSPTIAASEACHTKLDATKKSAHSPKSHLKHLIEVRRKVIAATMCPSSNEVLKNVDAELQHNPLRIVKTNFPHENTDIWNRSNDTTSSPSSSSEGYLSSVSSRGFFKPLSETSSDSQGSSSQIEPSLPIQSPSRFQAELLNVEKQSDRDITTLLNTRWHYNSADSGAFFMDSPGTEKKHAIGKNLEKRNSQDMEFKFALPVPKNAASSNMLEAQQIPTSSNQLPFSKHLGHHRIKNSSGLQNGHLFEHKYCDSDDTEDYLDLPIQKVCSVNGATAKSNNISCQEERFKKEKVQRSCKNKNFKEDKKLLNSEVQKFLQSIEEDRQFLKQNIKKNKLFRLHSPTIMKQSIIDFHESDDDAFFRDSYLSLPSS